ncbi:hypothetical protein REPUB_Repub05bG0101300 [Reevesia pubescens]
MGPSGCDGVLRDAAGFTVAMFSVIAIKWGTKVDSMPWKLWKLFSQIDSLLVEIDGVRFASIYRKANCLADNLAKKGVARSDFFMSWWLLLSCSSEYFRVLCFCL